MKGRKREGGWGSEEERSDGGDPNPIFDGFLVRVGVLLF
jgi:hypothetical protein